MVKLIFTTGHEISRSSTQGYALNDFWFHFVTKRKPRSLAVWHKTALLGHILQGAKFDFSTFRFDSRWIFAYIHEANYPNPVLSVGKYIPAGIPCLRTLKALAVWDFIYVCATNIANVWQNVLTWKLKTFFPPRIVIWSFKIDTVHLVSVAVL